MGKKKMAKARENQSRGKTKDQKPVKTQKNGEEAKKKKLF